MDHLYIRKVLEGDVYQFSYLVENYKDFAFSLAYRIVQNQEDAEDVVQDAFMKAFQSLHNFREDAKFSTWFYKIVVNTALSKTKKNKPWTGATDVSELPEKTKTEIDQVYLKLAQDQQRYYINKALDQLNIEDSLLLTLYYLHENSLEEIHEITEIPKENLKMKLHRARKKMYEKLSLLLQTEIKNLL